MNASQGRLGELFLRYASRLAGLRRVPVLRSCVSWASAKLVPRGALTWVQVRRGAAAGIWLHLNPRTGREVLEGGGELQMQEALKRFLRPGMVFYDVGSNIGFFALIAARLVGSQGRVIAFEADPEAAARLREHVARNGYGQVTVVEKAVWSGQGPVPFERVDPRVSPDRGLGHVVSVAAENSIPVEGVSLDAYAETAPPPDFLKCDVEGAEVEVFRGARRLLKDKRPGIICEVHSEANRQILLEEFARFGYSCESCDENHVLALPK
jgi:FkbM family methyltransferase